MCVEWTGSNVITLLHAIDNHNNQIKNISTPFSTTRFICILKYIQFHIKNISIRRNYIWHTIFINGVLPFFTTRFLCIPKYIQFTSKIYFIKWRFHPFLRLDFYVSLSISKSFHFVILSPLNEEQLYRSLIWYPTDSSRSARYP